MLNYTTAYAWVDCDKKGGCIPDAIFTIDGIDQLKARVWVGKDPSPIKPQECTPIDWMGTCVIDTLSLGVGEYYAKVSFGVTAPLDWFYCYYKGYIKFEFDGLHQVNRTIPLSVRCYWLDGETATTTD
jgi:hypothetical protein